MSRSAATVCQLRTAIPGPIGTSVDAVHVPNERGSPQAIAAHSKLTSCGAVSQRHIGPLSSCQRVCQHANRSEGPSTHRWAVHISLRHRQPLPRCHAMRVLHTQSSRASPHSASTGTQARKRQRRENPREREPKKGGHCATGMSGSCDAPTGQGGCCLSPRNAPSRDTPPATASTKRRDIAWQRHGACRVRAAAAACPPPVHHTGTKLPPPSRTRPRLVPQPSTHSTRASRCPTPAIRPPAPHRTRGSSSGLRAVTCSTRRAGEHRDRTTWQRQQQ
jgi:hypothetical protein